MRIGDIIFEEYPLMLAPLEDITDLPFRLICKRLGADLMYTEFISSDGLIRNGRKSIKRPAMTMRQPIRRRILPNS